MRIFKMFSGLPRLGWTYGRAGRWLARLSNRLFLPLFRFIAGTAVLCLAETPVQATCVASGNTVTCTGSSGVLTIPPPPGPSVIVNIFDNLNGGVTISSPVTDATVTNSGNVNGNITANGLTNFTFTQNGVFGGTDIIANTTGTNTLNVNAGRSVNGVTMSGATNSIDNSGTFNTNLNLTATTQNTITNRVGGAINQMTLNAPRNTINNEGTFNSAIQFTQPGLNQINNYSTGIINGINSTGNAIDQVRNDGRINGTISLGPGSDWYVNLGGTELGNVDMGAGNDIFYMEGGLISSPVDLGDGNDFAAVIDGTLSANFQAGAGNDTLHWSGGTVTAGIDMGAGDDRAFFYNLTEANLAVGMPINGGVGNDTMTWYNTTGGDVGRYLNWELIELKNNSNMIFSNFSTLRLGDSGTGTGDLVIDASSKVSAGNGTHTVAPFTSGQLANVFNAGTIDLTNGPETTTDRFVITGNYIGQSGNINLQTYLGTDDSPSDQLVIRGNGAAASGATAINIANVNGPGAQTVGNGIRVVDADLAGGARTAADAFVLGAPVGAGIFEYELFRGGVGADTGDNDWYLRSAVSSPGVPVTTLPTPAPPPVPVAPLPPLPVAPLPPPPPPTVTPTPLPPLPVPPPGPPTPVTPTVPVTPQPPPPAPLPPPDIPLIRPEIPGYTIAPAFGQQMAMLTLDKFHARQGDESLLDGRGGWGRIFGQTTEDAWTPRIGGMSYQLDPKLDGHIFGVQVGHDFYENKNADGSKDHVGLYFAHTEGRGDMVGNVLAETQVSSGTVTLDGENLGAYWTHTNPTGWYTDAVFMATWFDGDATSDRGIGADLSGVGVTTSLEGGYAFSVTSGWTLEPQGQIIFQNVALDDTQDRFSSIDYGSIDTWVGRLGVRLEGNTTINGTQVQPYFDVDVWENFGDDYAVVFNDRPIVTATDGTSLELGTGFTTKITSTISGYGGFKFMTGLDGPDGNSYGGNAGVRIKW